MKYITISIYGNSLWPVSNFGQKQFFIWGPIGGTETIPYDFIKHYNFKGQVIEFLRKLIVKSLIFNLPYRNRCKNANIILCKTENQKLNIPLKYRYKALLFTDVAVDVAGFMKLKKNIYKRKDRVNYLVVGKLDPWRGFDILIEAFEKATKINPNIFLNIVGNGIDFKRLSKIIIKRNLSNRVNMFGKVTYETYKKIIKETDVVVTITQRRCCHHIL